MGNKQGTTRRTKEQTNEVKQNRMNFISFRKNQLDVIGSQLQNDAVQKIKETTDTNDAIAVLNDINTKAAFLQTTQKQLDREGAPLTKADLIAIIVALDPVTFSQNINQLNANNTVQDLNTMIRLIIYDPSRYMNNESDLTPMNEIKQITDLHPTTLITIKNR
jgi:hypothetical protein